MRIDVINSPVGVPFLINTNLFFGRKIMTDEEETGLVVTLLVVVGCGVVVCCLFVYCGTYHGGGKNGKIYIY